jgi:hypothetical protein
LANSHVEADRILDVKTIVQRLETELRVTSFICISLCFV